MSKKCSWPTSICSVQVRMTILYLDAYIWPDIIIYHASTHLLIEYGKCADVLMGSFMFFAFWMRIAILAVHFLKDISRSAITNYLNCFTAHTVNYWSRNISFFANTNFILCNTNTADVKPFPVITYTIYISLNIAATKRWQLYLHFWLQDSYCC